MDKNRFFFFKNISLENRSINTVLTHVFVLIIDMHRFFFNLDGPRLIPHPENLLFFSVDIM